MPTLRPRHSRPRYREYPPSEISSAPTPSSSPFRIFDLPLELIDRIISLVAPRTRLSLAYTSRAAHSLLIPLIYRTIDISSPERLLGIFASPTVSHLVQINRYTRSLNLCLPLDGPALAAVRTAAALYPSCRLMSRPINLILTQKARWSLLDYPRYVEVLRYFSADIALHVKWSGPSRIAFHFDSLFAIFGLVASGCHETTFHVHLGLNEFLRMPADALGMFRLSRPSRCAIRVYVHPNLQRAGTRERKAVDAVSQLRSPVQALRSAFMAGRRADESRWDEAERAKKLVPRDSWHGPISSRPFDKLVHHRITKNSKPIPEGKMARFELIVLGRTPDEMREVEMGMNETMTPRGVGEGDCQLAVSGCTPSYEGPTWADFEIRGTLSKGNCGVCGE